MFDALTLITNIIHIISITFLSVVALDYLFGTDRFEDIRDMISDGEEIQYGVSVVLLICTGFMYLIGYVADVKPLMGFSVVVCTVLWAIWWLYGLVVFGNQAIVTFRNNNIRKRKKPL